MWPLRPTAIATPGATASSSAVLTILSRAAGSAVSRPESFSPICGAMYLIGVGAVAIRAGGGGGAHAAIAANNRREERGASLNFICWTSPSVLDEYRRPPAAPAAAKLAIAR